MLAGLRHWIITDLPIRAVYSAGIGVGNDRLGFSKSICVTRDILPIRKNDARTDSPLPSQKSAGHENARGNSSFRPHVGSWRTAKHAGHGCRYHQRATSRDCFALVQRRDQQCRHRYCLPQRSADQRNPGSGLCRLYAGPAEPDAGRWRSVLYPSRAQSSGQPMRRKHGWGRTLAPSWRATSGIRFRSCVLLCACSRKFATSFPAIDQPGK